MKDTKLLKDFVESHLAVYENLSYKDNDDFVQGAMFILKSLKEKLALIENKKQAWTADAVKSVASGMDYEPDYEKAPAAIILDDDQAEEIARQANEIDASEDAVREMIMAMYEAWIEKQNYLRSIP